jgi:NAD(P)-dependent dehydrogenase (short-subunit alcohol dehydrogenase family)
MTAGRARLSGKRALVTGASSGIGSGIASTFAREGAAVAIGAHSGVDRAKKLAQEINQKGGRAIVVVGDLMSRDQTDRVVDETVAEFGGLDILVHNAGIDYTSPALVGDTSDDFWDRCLAIHLTAGFRLVKRALPSLLQGHGPAILFIGSVAGEIAWEKDVAYNVAKAGLHHLTRCIAVDYAKMGVRANCVAPGVVDTPLVRASKPAEKKAFDSAMARLAAMHPVGRCGNVDEVAAAALFLVSDEASFITGVVLPVDGGLTAG